MTHIPHQLHQEFPDQAKLLKQLALEDQHFARLCDDYHMVNRDIHRAETDVQPTDDFTMQDMRKRRLALKDEIWHRLKAARAHT
jgi:uncharacterized protein YdcH (DUF465 family)